MTSQWVPIVCIDWVASHSFGRDWVTSRNTVTLLAHDQSPNKLLTSVTTLTHTQWRHNNETTHLDRQGRLFGKIYHLPGDGEHIRQSGERNLLYSVLTVVATLQLPWQQVKEWQVLSRCISEEDKAASARLSPYVTQMADHEFLFTKRISSILCLSLVLLYTTMPTPI